MVTTENITVQETETARVQESARGGFLFPILDFLLADLRWYRRRRGGHWVCTRDEASCTGFAPAISIWERDPDALRADVIAEERY